TDRIAGLANHLADVVTVDDIAEVARLLRHTALLQSFSGNDRFQRIKVDRMLRGMAGTFGTLIQISQSESIEGVGSTVKTRNKFFLLLGVHWEILLNAFLGVGGAIANAVMKKLGRAPVIISSAPYQKAATWIGVPSFVAAMVSGLVGGPAGLVCLAVFGSI